MRLRAVFQVTSVAVALAVASLLMSRGVQAGQGATRVAIDGDDVGGVVTGPNGPEAGVWVIAETSDLQTPFTRTVVTDDQGRYVIPDLPKATYRVWVRGYGLVDSPKQAATLGRTLNLTAVPAPNERAAAEYYPAAYWFSLFHPPESTAFPGTGANGNGIPTQLKNQAAWLRSFKSGDVNSCTACHSMGTRGTRTITPDVMSQFPSSTAAWNRRVQSGQAGGNMNGGLNVLGRNNTLSLLADWTDRIAKGEVPAAPPRPQGQERNVVITQWDWADPKAYVHDEVATDRRNPRVNANGPIYGATELSTNYMPVVDPSANAASKVELSLRDPSTPPAQSAEMLQPSPYHGAEAVWTSQTNVHNPMMDGQGRVWLTQTVRPAANPDYCKAGSEHPSAKAFPINNAPRHLSLYDPKSKKLTHISTCFNTHHLMFAEDKDDTLWISSAGGAPVVGWFNTKRFEETHDEAASQGWTALILDTNGNGKRDAYVAPNQPVDPTKDKQVGGIVYATSAAPDGSVWGAVMGFPGGIFRVSPGDNPPSTALTEWYEPPVSQTGEPVAGYSPRGGDVDRNGVFWVALASGHLGSFDRKKCKGPLNGPAATGQHCPEGWSFYAEPGPQFKGVNASGSVEASYYTWVDQFNTLGLGANTPINTGNAAEGLLVLKDGKWIVLRVPYPAGAFYARWMDGRIDNPNTGWKGRGVWSTVATRTPFHSETGKGTNGKVIKFQLRPDPLAH